MKVSDRRDNGRFHTPRPSPLQPLRMREHEHQLQREDRQQDDKRAKEIGGLNHGSPPSRRATPRQKRRRLAFSRRRKSPVSRAWHGRQSVRYPSRPHPPPPSAIGTTWSASHQWPAHNVTPHASRSAALSARGPERHLAQAGVPRRGERAPHQPRVQTRRALGPEERDEPSLHAPRARLAREDEHPSAGIGAPAHRGRRRASTPGAGATSEAPCARRRAVPSAAPR